MTIISICMDVLSTVMFISGLMAFIVSIMKSMAYKFCSARFVA